MRVRLNTEDNNTRLVIEPIDFRLSDIPKLPIYIMNMTGGYMDKEKCGVVLTSADINSIYQKIRKILEDRLQLEVEIGENAESILRSAEDESMRFMKFANKALQIRNSNIDQDELRDYLRILSATTFKRILKPYQLLSSYHIAFSQNACNFSVPGSGKTTTVLAAYEYLRNTNDQSKRVNKLLVVGPLAAFGAWKNEYKECFGKEPLVFEIRGGIRNETIEDALLRSNVPYDIIIASYGSIPSKLDILKSFLINNPSMVVLDEAHRIKNAEDGIQSNAALQLSDNAKSRVILTGTPAANSYVDLYNLYKFIWPSNNVIGYSVAQLANMSKSPNDERVGDLTQRISPFFIRVKKADLNLPEATFNAPINVEMSPIQKRIYEDIAATAIGKIESNNVNQIFKRSAIIRMRQAATNPNLLNKSLDDYYESLDGDYFTKTKLDSTIDASDETLELIRNYKNTEVPSKFAAALQLIKDKIANNEKVLVWCEFVGTCDDFSDYLLSNGISNQILYGATIQEDREKIIDAFANPNNHDFMVVIANPHAVGESISLHKGCHNAVYLEQGFNAGTYMQSKDRIHRVGLPENAKTNYYYLHSIDTTDPTVYERVMLKEKRMLDIIEKEEIPLLARNADFLEDTEDDIKAIIRGYYEARR